MVGGGPAGMMLGLLLARAGVEVLVLEKHGDFFRDFRGDTIHPSTLELLNELGLLEEFLQLPHQKVHQLRLKFDDISFIGPDFSHLPTRCKFIAFMPQWDFLNFIAQHARRLPHFSLKMNAEVTGVIVENGRVVGVRAKTSDGELEVRADLVFGTDGRHSVVRESAGLEVRESGVPIDVLWFRLPKPKDGQSNFLGRIKNGTLLVTLDRDDYYQVGFVIPKGAFSEIKSRGLAAFQETIAAIAPSLRAVVAELDDWEKIKLLTVQVNHLRRWFRPGLLCIGDAAHAMSPAGGVGINLAIQDAVAAANLLGAKLRRGECMTADLSQVQQRREWAVRAIQMLQVFLHRRMFRKVGGTAKAFAPSWPVRKFFSLFAPLLRRIAAHIFGIGLRPEHILK